MDRVLKMPVGLAVKRVSYQLGVIIDLTNTPIPEWCLNLCLLEQELVDTLVFVIGKKTLKIEVDNIEDSRRANVFFAPNQVHVKVDPAELEGWLDFFLKYYRDGVAQVDHIDVEALAISEKPEDIYITFIVKDALPAISAEEARKILDKYD
jgi:hypothetical protein